MKYGSSGSQNIHLKILFKKGVLFIYFLQSFDGTQDFPVTPGLCKTFGKSSNLNDPFTLPFSEFLRTDKYL